MGLAQEKMSNHDPHDNLSAVQPRRQWLADSWTLLKSAAALVLLLPVFRFVGFHPPRRPRLVRVNKTLKPGGFIIEPDFVIFDEDSGPVAVSRRCTHLGCRLNFHELENLLICPCHQSRFTRSGVRVAGPARLNLPCYEVAVSSGPEPDSFVVSVT